MYTNGWFRQYWFLYLSASIVFAQWFALMLNTHRQTDVWFLMHHRGEGNADLPCNLQDGDTMNHLKVIQGLQTNLEALEEEIRNRDKYVRREKGRLAVRKKQIESQTYHVTQQLEKALNQSKIQQDRIEVLEAELSKFRTPNCTCVDCWVDQNCGGLWKGSAVGGNPYAFDRITLVVSHCLKPLHWLEEFTRGFVVDDITIISKCNATVVGAPPNSTIVRLPNVGRCDHSYAHWIHQHVAATNQNQRGQNQNRVVFFLKDDRSEKSIHQAGVWRNFTEMLRIASQNDFACGMEPTKETNGVITSISAYHETSELRNFKLKRYTSKRKVYDHIKEEAPFASPLYNTMGNWVDDMNLDLPQDLVEVCYGGTFAATTRQLYKKPITVWSNLTYSLSRGGNIVEGHYAERAWGGLLSNPPAKRQVEALRKHGTWILKFPSYIWGALVEENKGKYITRNQYS